MGLESYNKFLKIRKARIADTGTIFKILSESFKEYKDSYTTEAFRVTILNPSEIKRRILDENMTLMVLLWKNHIIGTVSIEITKNGEILHIRSMAIDPKYQKKGFSKFLIKQVIKLGQTNQAKYITLECFKPLLKAQKLYEKTGFRKSGKKRSYYGIEIFEMVLYL